MASEAKRHGTAFCLNVREARPAQVCVARRCSHGIVCPRVELGAPVLEVRDDLRQELAAPAVDPARSPRPLGVPVDAIWARLRLLHGLVCETKQQFWKRLLAFEEVARKEAALHVSWLVSVRLVAKVCREKNQSPWFFQYPSPLPLPLSPRPLQKWMLMNRPIFRRSHGASFVKWASDDRSVIGPTCLKIESVREVWCSWIFFFCKASNERTELGQEAWSTALAVVTWV